MIPEVQEWLAQAEYDFSAAEAMFNHLKFLGILDAIGPHARYPKDLQAALKAYLRKVAKDYLARTREVLECLKNDPILKP
ncbi:hypothetical protein SDD30_01640 [Moorella naiadis]|uniref:hypothetical protein n=1 Tax=Moorella naiadis (nom. illeg.) TaxID=3093670 RepID=UPI003D9CBA25